MEFDWPFFSLVIGLIGIVLGAIARDRYQQKVISDAISLGDEKCHNRINDLNKELRNYLTKEDLMAQFAQINKNISEMNQNLSQEQKRTNERIDSVLQNMINGYS